jgi:hypothetical protein
MSRLPDMSVAFRLVSNVWLRVAAAIGIGLSGFPFHLYERLAYTDEIIHFCASFVLAPVVAAFVAPETFARAKMPRLGLLIVTTWLGAMAVWETAEWLMAERVGLGLLVGYSDTITDLMIDAAAAALSLSIARRDGAPHRADPDA